MRICQTFGCENLAEGTTEFCGSCNRTHRKVAQNRVKEQQKKELRLSKPMPTRSKVKPVSDKQKERLDEYKVLRWEYLIAHPKCEMRLIGCEDTATEIHHTAGRGKQLNVVSSWKATCRHCHSTLHDKLSASEARGKGLKL